MYILFNLFCETKSLRKPHWINTLVSVFVDLAEVFFWRPPSSISYLKWGRALKNMWPGLILYSSESSSCVLDFSSFMQSKNWLTKCWGTLTTNLTCLLSTRTSEWNNTIRYTFGMWYQLMGHHSCLLVVQCPQHKLKIFIMKQEFNLFSRCGQK